MLICILNKFCTFLKEFYAIKAYPEIDWFKIKTWNQWIYMYWQITSKKYQPTWNKTDIPKMRSNAELGVMNKRDRGIHQYNCTKKQQQKTEKIL